MSHWVLSVALCRDAKHFFSSWEVWFIRLLSKQNVISTVPNVHHSRETDIHREKIFSTIVKLYESTVCEVTFNSIPKPPFQIVQEMSACVNSFSSTLSLVTHLSIPDGHTDSQNNGKRPEKNFLIKLLHSHLSYFLWHAIVSSVSLEIVVCIEKEILIILFKPHVKIKRDFHWICYKIKWEFRAIPLLESKESSELFLLLSDSSDNHKRGNTSNQISLGENITSYEYTEKC